MKNILLFTFLYLSITVAFTACDDDNSSPSPIDITTSAELTAALTDIYEQENAPGFAVSVIKDSEILYQQAFGFADMESERAYTNQTTQPIGSISKTFVAAALVKAIEQGYFTLETNINDILPIELVNPRQPDAVVKVKHLVTHTSGLLDRTEAYFESYRILPGENIATQGAQILTDGFGFTQREAIDLDELLVEYYLEDGYWYSSDNFASTTPGTNWSYSNIATSLAAYLVEAATETDFATYVEEQILQPLSMTRTSYLVDDLDPAQVAELYWQENVPFPIYATDSYPDGGLRTSNIDLAKYLLDMMKGVKGQSSTLFSSTGYDMLFDPQLPNGLIPPSLADNQGVFWFLDGNTIRHDGSDPGTTCKLQFDADGESGYLLMTNMDASTQAHEDAYFRLDQRIDQVINQFTQAN